MEHLRFEQRVECGDEGRSSPLVDVGVVEHRLDGPPPVERPDDADDIGMAEEDEFAIAVVVRECAERLWPQRDPGVESEDAFENCGGSVHDAGCHDGT